MSTNAPARRGFLRSLATLPLIGGGVTLIGNPTAAAEPVTDALMDAYSEWLFYERRLLCLERWPDFPDAEKFVPANTGAGGYHFPAGRSISWRELPQPSTRAAVMLAAAGCDWRGGRGEHAKAFGAIVAGAAAVPYKPDPMPALVEAEQIAWEAFEKAVDRVSAAEEALEAAGLSKRPRVETGVMTSYFDRDGKRIPKERRTDEPIYSYSRAEIIEAYAGTSENIAIEVGDRHTRIVTTRRSAVEDALADFDAQVSRREAAPEMVELCAAEAARDAASDKAAEALSAVYDASPTTVAGLLAMLSVAEKREHCATDLPSVLAAVRTVVGRLA